MKTSTIQVRIDPKLKEAANKVLEEIGLTPSQVVNILYKAIVRDQGLPIDLHIPNDETARALRSNEYYEFANEEDVERWLSGEGELEDFTLKKVSGRSKTNEKAGKIVTKHKKSDRATKGQKTVTR